MRQITRRLLFVHWFYRLPTIAGMHHSVPASAAKGLISATIWCSTACIFGSLAHLRCLHCSHLPPTIGAGLFVLLSSASMGCSAQPYFSRRRGPHYIATHNVRWRSARRSQPLCSCPTTGWCFARLSATAIHGPTRLFLQHMARFQANLRPRRPPRSPRPPRPPGVLP